MAEFVFNDIEFKEEKERVKLIFLKHFYTYIDKKKLNSIGEFKIKKNSIEFNASEKKSNRFNFLLNNSFNNLKNFKGKPATYIHQNSGIPLIGTGYFGIVDRGTNLIEVKPITGCNLKCIYCSVDEDKRTREFVVEKDYIIQELDKVLQIKEKPIEMHIAANGEPLLYKPLIALIKDLSKHPKVRKISVETNGVLLSKDKVDELVEAGLDQFNFSLNSLDKKTAQIMSGCSYPLENIKEILKYISKKCRLVIAPVLIEDINEKDMDDIIIFSKKIGAKVGIQNYLNYKHGRNVKKQMEWNKFYQILEKLEKKHNIKLTLSESDFSIENDNSLKKPFKKNNIIEADITSEGRFKNEMLAVSKDRVITVINCDKKGKQKIRIIRSKHNIFIATLL
jgi:uncharacterized protein